MRPIRLIEGGHEVNEVFFTDVRVPAENLVGEENQGWTIAKYLLTHERTNIAGVGFSVQAFERLQVAGASGQARRAAADRESALRRAAGADRDRSGGDEDHQPADAVRRRRSSGAPGPESSMLKIKGTVIRQALNDLTRRALGPCRGAVPVGGAGERGARPARARARGGAVLQQPQDLDLRRLERDPAQHPGQGGAGPNELRADRRPPDAGRHAGSLPGRPLRLGAPAARGLHGALP